MAEKKLTLEMLVRAYIDCIETYNGNMPPFLNYVGAYLDPKLTSDSSKKRCEDLYASYVRRGPMPKSCQSIIDRIKAAENERGEEASDIIGLVTFIERAFSEGSNCEDALLLLIDRLGRPEFFYDQDFAYKVAKFIAGNKERMHWSNVVLKKAYDVLANNKNATAEDIANTLQFCSEPEKIFATLEAVCEKTRADITKEMSKEGPDIVNLRKVISVPGVAVIMAKEKIRHMPKLIEKEAEINEEFSYDKIIAGGKEYFPEYEERQSQKLAKQVADLESDKAALKSQVESLQRNVQQIDVENMSLKRENEDLADRLKRAKEVKAAEYYAKEEALMAKGKAEREVQLLRAQLKVLADLMAKVRGGLGSKGLDDLRAAVERANAVEL